LYYLALHVFKYR